MIKFEVMFKYFNFCQFLPPDFNNSNKSKLLEASDDLGFLQVQIIVSIKLILYMYHKKLNKLPINSSLVKCLLNLIFKRSWLSP